MQGTFNNLVLNCSSNFTFSKEYTIQHIKETAKNIGNNLNERKKILEQQNKKLKKQKF